MESVDNAETLYSNTIAINAGALNSAGMCLVPVYWGGIYRHYWEPPSVLVYKAKMLVDGLVSTRQGVFGLIILVSGCGDVG